MVLFALVPGLPFLPFVFGAAALGGAALLMAERARRAAEKPEPKASAEAEVRRPGIGDLLDLDDIHLRFAPDLVGMVLDPSTGLEARISSMRDHVATEFGIILPEIRLTDEAGLPGGRYDILVQGVAAGSGTLRPDRVLTLLPEDPSGLPDGEDVEEPVYAAPARWIDRADRETVALAGLTSVTPPEVLATHLLEVIKQNLPRLLTLKSLRRLLDALTQLSDAERAEANRRLLDELVPDKVPVELLLAVMRALLEEEGSVRNLHAILECIADQRSACPTLDALTEAVRHRLAPQLVATVQRPDGSLPLLQLAPEWEAHFERHGVGGEGSDVALPPDLFQKLTASVADILAKQAASGT